MKNFVLSLALIGFFAMEMGAQCSGDPSFGQFGPGVYPAPDTTGMNSPLPCGSEGTAYETILTAIITDDTVNLGGFDVILNQVELTGIFYDNSGVPAPISSIGLNYACNDPDCIFDQTNSSPTTPGCAIISGTPTTGSGSASGTDYDIIVTANVSATIAASGTPLTLPVQFGGANTVVPGEYILTIFDDAANCVTSTEALANVVSVGQNMPNPFVGSTTIQIDAVESAQYTFGVTNMLGATVHNEIINVLPGANLVEFDASNLTPGVYLYTVSNGDDVITKRMVVSK